MTDTARSSKRGAGRPAILVPAFNEERTVGAVVENCRATRLPVFVVDDGSVDGTAERAADAGAIVLRREPNGGVGAALMLGIGEALERGFDTVVLIDGDGAHDARFAPKLLACLRRSQADLVLGSRFCNRSWATSIPSGKRAANRFATLVLNSLTGRDFTDVATGMRALGPRALAIQLTTEDFGFMYEMIAASARAGLVIEEAPIKVRYDALEPMFTSRREILDFVTFAIACAGASPRRNALERLLEQVEQFCLICARVGKEHFVLLPVREYGAYAFQLQDRWFVSQLETPWMEIVP